AAKGSTDAVEARSWGDWMQPAAKSAEPTKSSRTNGARDMGRPLAAAGRRARLKRSCSPLRRSGSGDAQREGYGAVQSRGLALALARAPARARVDDLHGDDARVRARGRREEGDRQVAPVRVVEELLVVDLRLDASELRAAKLCRHDDARAVLVAAGLRVVVVHQDLQALAGARSERRVGRGLEIHLFAGEEEGSDGEAARLLHAPGGGLAVEILAAGRGHLCAEVHAGSAGTGTVGSKRSVYAPL